MRCGEWRAVHGVQLMACQWSSARLALTPARVPGRSTAALDERSDWPGVCWLCANHPGGLASAMKISTRRFCARPASVSLDATGCRSAMPEVLMRVGETPRLTR